MNLEVLDKVAVKVRAACLLNVNKGEDVLVDIESYGRPLPILLDTLTIGRIEFPSLTLGEQD